MKINTTAHFGLITAGYIAERADEGWVMSNTIAEEYDIPPLYLLKIMQEMVKANILRSKRGPGGGYTLARPAKEITLLEIIEVAGGPISSQLNMAELTGNAEFSVNMEKMFMKGYERAASILSRAKLSQMVG